MDPEVVKFRTSNRRRMLLAGMCVLTAAIRDLVKENIDKKNKAGEEVPEKLQAFHDQLVKHTQPGGTTEE